MITQSIRRLRVDKDNWNPKRVCCYAVPIIVMLLSGLGLLLTTGNAPKFLADIADFDVDKLEDPFSTGVQLSRWKTSGNKGLSLTIVNACDDSWLVRFELAVADWDFGNPDALILSKEKIKHDSGACNPIDGKVKVCNANYGEKPWKGLNSLTTDKDGFVTASVAKLNDYYLERASEDERQYTICHELGHSFTLGHSDEEFDNDDLGNCMDYTRNFKKNKHPDATNYQALLEMYGPAGGRRGRKMLRSRLEQPLATNVDERDPSQEADAEEGTGMPDEIQKKMSSVVEDFASHGAHPERHARLASKGWTLMHHVPSHIEEHEMDLGEGYKVRVKMLLA